MLLEVIIAMNLLTFFVMGLDKWKAKRALSRISEKTLFVFATAAGAPGGVAGMIVFRHKTRKVKFVFFFPLLAFIQLLLLFYFKGAL